VRRYVAYSVLAAAGAFFLYVAYLAFVVTAEFDARGWDVPAQVFAAPLEIYGGRRLSADDLEIEIDRLGYRRVGQAPSTGAYTRAGNRFLVQRRAFDYAGERTPAQALEIDVRGGTIASIADGTGAVVAITDLDPLLIGSIFPTHGEDRIIVEPDEVPALLTETLKVIEDRRFDDHLGVDLRAMLRAALVNLKSGEIRQGASTLTQQLVRSYFLTNERTWRRKIREVLMALALELRHDKEELLLAYVNEIYLGQDGARAIHGFGLASRFYFGKPLGELGDEEIALLVAIVRGPSYYDPRRYPERALARRNLVLDQMLAAGLIDDRVHAAALARDLGVVSGKTRRTTYYASFLDLVRRQLRRDYADEDLRAKGLKVYTTLDPAIQAAAEEAIVAEIERLQPNRPELESAVVVTTPHNAEVSAVVGSRRIGLDGYNRALDARRPIGSLVKPAVYLAALESGDYSLATQIDDVPIDVPLDNGQMWSPTNFDGEPHGLVTAVRALAESLNLATVHLGLAVGLEPVADTLVRLGADTAPPLYPSLLLGAVELTPLEVTQIYNTLANGGFRVPLRAVRAVVDRNGETMQRYPLEIEQVGDPGAVFALNQGLVQVMRRGTGRTVRARLTAAGLPESVLTAGKSGTSDGLRDSWFAGFSGDRLVVAWVGNDANAGVGLTGSTGAGPVWASVMSAVATSGYSPPPPAGVKLAWIDYDTGLTTDDDCPAAVPLALSAAEAPPKAVACGSTKTRIGSRIRQWLRNQLH
jgi:penicillin-binding protein 1B